MRPMWRQALACRGDQVGQAEDVAAVVRQSNRRAQRTHHPLQMSLGDRRGSFEGDGGCVARVGWIGEQPQRRLPPGRLDRRDRLKPVATLGACPLWGQGGQASACLTQQSYFATLPL